MIKFTEDFSNTERLKALTAWLEKQQDDDSPKGVEFLRNRDSLVIYQFTLKISDELALTICLDFTDPEEKEHSPNPQFRVHAIHSDPDEADDIMGADITDEEKEAIDGLLFNVFGDGGNFVRTHPQTGKEAMGIATWYIAGALRRAFSGGWYVWPSVDARVSPDSAAWDEVKEGASE